MTVSSDKHAIANLIDLRDRLRKFALEREWDQFHTPKNLAIALSVEASELLEHFQWLTADESVSISDEQSSEIQKELADVLFYLVRLADKLEINILDAATEKLRENGKKYPISKARGNRKKYTDF